LIFVKHGFVDGFLILIGVTSNKNSDMNRKKLKKVKEDE